MGKEWEGKTRRRKEVEEEEEEVEEEPVAVDAAKICALQESITI